MSTRLVRRYRIHAKSRKRVTLKWQEKFVTDPDNSRHFIRGSKPWRNRQRTMPVTTMHKRWNRNPPQDQIGKEAND